MELKMTYPRNSLNENPRDEEMKEYERRRRVAQFRPNG